MSTTSSHLSVVGCEPTVFQKNAFQTISRHNFSSYRHPCFTFCNEQCYPPEKTILEAAQASAKNPQLSDDQLGWELWFTDYKFFSAVAASHILNNPISVRTTSASAEFSEELSIEPPSGFEHKD
jgi:hypothetical protein